MTPIFPMPAAERYCSTGEPKPPAPTTKIEVDLSFFCPDPPISRIIICREYRSNSTSEKLASEKVFSISSSIFFLDKDLRRLRISL